MLRTKDNEWLVTLVRSPWLHNVTYRHPTKALASQRAYTLAELHHCTVSVIGASHRIWVHASAYYAKKGD